jgi:HlyD family secretion protein
MVKNLALAGVLATGACSRAAERDANAYQGIVELHERQLGFEVQGRLRERQAQRGQRVEEGRVLAVLDDGLERPARDAKEEELRGAQAQLDLLRAGTRVEDVRATEAQLRGARAAERTAAEHLLRTRLLYERAVAPKAQLDDAESQVARTRSERESLEEKLRAQRSGSRSQEIRAAQARADAARASLEAADARLARYVLRAPVAGTVLDTSAEPGEVLAAGTPVATIGETRRPYVDVFVAQQDLAGVRVGARAQVWVDASMERLRGVVEDVARTTEFTPRFLFSPTERANLVVRVRIAIDDPREELHAGVPAFAAIERSVRVPEARR